MPFFAPLDRADALDILRWLGVPPPTGETAWFDMLLVAWTRRVPWESASRILRRQTHAQAEACVVAPAAFWAAAIDRGCGGTCFESNAALAALLGGLGVPHSLTINDRPPVPASHTALIVEAAGERLVVDAGFPIYGAVPLPIADETRECVSTWGTFRAVRTGDRRILITQHPHPHPLAFELIDVAVPAATYHAATCADYGPDGLFLDRVIIKKIVGGDSWRFASGERPWVLERFRDGVRYQRPLPADVNGAAAEVAAHFAIDRMTVERALTAVTAGAQ